MTPNTDFKFTFGMARHPEGFAGRVGARGTLQGVATWRVTSFYKFLPVRDPAAWKQELHSWMLERGMLGLTVLAPEGINGTVASTAGLLDFKEMITERIGEVRFKDSTTDRAPFKRLSVDVRREIVGMKRPDLTPSESDTHLSAAEWQAMLLRDPVVIDTRNRYETRLGAFKGAIDPGLDHFSEWPAYVAEAHLPTDRPILIYCTGGIRCEKGILAMQQQGYDNVYQLKDGILGYLETFPNEQFEGECFVFDDRVSVGQDLQPTGNFGICPGCGLTSGQVATCERCGSSYFVCEECVGGWKVCSKACRCYLRQRR